MAKIAFLGLGQMGTPMAGRLLDAGHDLTVWNRSADRAAPFADRARVASTPADAAAGVDVVITMLTDAHALEPVLFGFDGAAGALAPDQVLVEMSTIGPDAARSIRERLPQGVGMVDAPVRGSVPQATDGSLIVLVGATDEDYARVSGVLGSFGTVQRIGGPGAAAAMKLVANATIGAVMATIGEALALGEGLGLDRTSLLDMLAETPIGSAVTGKRRAIESGEYPANFKLSLALKDLDLVVDAAGAAGRDLRVAEASRAWFRQAADEGAGDQDYVAVIATILSPTR